MFVDYSGLQRFSIINESFANKYLQILHFDAIKSPEERLNKLKESSDGMKSVQAVRLEDFKLDWGIIDYMYKMLLCITQMQEVASYIRRCPTVYLVEMFDRACPMSRYSMENLSGSLLKMYQDLQKAYDGIRTELLNEVKSVIVELKPDYDFTDYNQWHVLQKYLYYECCSTLPHQDVPKTDVVIIPKTFPRLFVEQVNQNGFMRASSRVRFFMFDTKSSERSFDPISVHDLELKALGDKVTTIWKEHDDKESIGSESERSASTNQTNRSARAGSTIKEPEFIRLFKEQDPNVEGSRPSVKFEEPGETSESKQKDERPRLRGYQGFSHVESEEFTAERASSEEASSASPINSDLEEEDSETDHSSTDKSQENEVFSPMGSGNLPTALTPDNDSDVPPHQKQQYSYNNKVTPSMFPPPPDLPPNAFKDYYAHQSKRESVKLKFKEYVAKPIQKCFTRNPDSMGFDTIDSFAEFQGVPWDDMSSKRFIKYTFKKLKRDCRYYKQIAKRFFEDIHESNP